MKEYIPVAGSNYVYLRTNLDNAHTTFEILYRIEAKLAQLRL